MKLLILILSICLPFMAFAQFDTGFLLNPREIKLSDSKYIFEPQPYFSSRPATQVGLSGSNETDRTIMNTQDGVYLSASITQTNFKGQKIEYPVDVVEAFIKTQRSAIYARTTFDAEKKAATSRTNCEHKDIFARSGQRGQEFNCTTVTPKLCTKLMELKGKMDSTDFHEISKKINQCKDALIFLGSAAKDLRTYIDSPEYKNVDSENSQELNVLRKRDAKKFNLTIEKDGFLVPDKLNLFRSGDFSAVSARSLFNELGDSLDNIKKLTTGCGALEAATNEVNEAVLPNSRKVVKGLLRDEAGKK